MKALAVVFEAPERIALARLPIDAPGPADVVVEVSQSGISTGTERLLYTGEMPSFPGLGYPLVPGYEAVGVVGEAGPASGFSKGEAVFVPGARCFGEVRGLFGGSASTIVVPSQRVTRIEADLGENGVLLALAATAHHALAGGALPQLIVGHGVLGRLLARLTIALGGDAPLVWETNPARRGGSDGYSVVAPTDDDRRDYATIMDASGDSRLLDPLIGRLAKGGEIALAGFYDERLSFAFAPAFMREARLRIAAEWNQPDLDAVIALVGSRKLSLGGLITHRQEASDPDPAYRAAFADPACLKMVLDWRGLQ
jgi:bacteriochlorophyllide a dehydrogenase